MKEPINFLSKFDLFSEQWTPKVIAEMNDYQFKLVRIQGDFVWHEHKETDEVFVVIEGSMGIEFKDRSVELSNGDMIVVKKGEQHRPFAGEECKILLVEPRGVVNTGNAGEDLTAKNDVWI